MKFNNEKRPNDSPTHTHTCGSSSGRHNFGYTSHNMLEPKRQLYKAHKRGFVLHSILSSIFCFCDTKNRVHKQVYVTVSPICFVSNQNLNVVKLSLSS